MSSKKSSQTKRSHAHKGEAVRRRRKIIGHRHKKVSKDCPPLITQVLTPRICLKCREEFPSEGPGNRICDKCNEANKYQGKNNKYKLVSAKGNNIG